MSIQEQVYIPWELSWTSHDKRWTLEFISQPTPDIKLTGDVPTLEELLHIVGSMNNPFLLLEVVWIVIQVEVMKRNPCYDSEKAAP